MDGKHLGGRLVRKPDLNACSSNVLFHISTLPECVYCDRWHMNDSEGLLLHMPQQVELNLQITL
jgi:hypothetical protein